MAGSTDRILQIVIKARDEAILRGTYDKLI